MVEIWKPVRGFEGWYSVSSLGRIRRERPGQGTFTGKIRVLGLTRGYPQVTLSRGDTGHRACIFVHREVAHAFLGPRPEGLVVNHKNSDKTDNRVMNLEYCTQQENIRHAIVEGNAPSLSLQRGENNRRAKLSDADVLAIRKLYETGRYRQRRLAEMYGVDPSTISAVITGKNWEHL